MTVLWGLALPENINMSINYNCAVSVLNPIRSLINNGSSDNNVLSVLLAWGRGKVESNILKLSSLVVRYL